MGAELLTAAGAGSRLTRPGPAVEAAADLLLTAPDSRLTAPEAAARRTLRAQIATLEAQLAEAFVTAFEMRLDHAGEVAAAAVPGPRLLDLSELEQVRDDLAGRLRELRLRIATGAERQARKRELLAHMQLEPGRHRFTRISCRELGEPGCGVWQVRPRLGPVGMLMGWWQVTLSSGCPLAGGRRRRATPSRP